MFLYEKNGDIVDMYSFMADKNDLIEYRKKILELKDFDKLFYIFETSSERIKNRFLNEYQIDIRFLNQKEDKEHKWWSSLKQDTIESYGKSCHYESLIFKYIKGSYSHLLPIRTFIPEDGMDCHIGDYLIIGSPIVLTSQNKDQQIYTKIEDIISLPRELYMLQLLENGKFEILLSDWNNFDEQLRLFKTRKVCSINIEELKEIHENNIVSQTFNDTMKKVETTEKILEKIKK